jgi:predicted nucleic acid-binding protein
VGPVSLPTSGTVYVDTQIIVYTVESHPIFAPHLRQLWAAVNSGAIAVVTSDLTLLEMLIHPLRHNDQRLIATLDAFVAQPGITLAAISPQILRAAAAMRAAVQRSRTPDAIHAATAQVRGCNAFLTNDAGLRSLPGLNIIMLADLK